MFAHGKHYLQSEIDEGKSILESMIQRFPNILKGEIAYYETIMKEKARIAAQDDSDIKLSYEHNSPYNDVIDFQENVLVYYYSSLAIMIYTYGESSLKHICEYAKIDINKIRKDILKRYYSKLREKYVTLPELDEIWSGREPFQNIRNKITHDLTTLNHESTQEYLSHNLNESYNMLCAVLNEVINSK